MNRILFTMAVVVALAVVACGGGDKKTAAKPAQPPAATATTAADTRASTPAAGGGEQAVGSIFQTLFSSGALSRGTGGNGSGAILGGNESLKQYLLTKDDVPAGYMPFGEFTYRIPDGISKNGGIDMAASMFMSGDLAANDVASTTIMVSMVLKPDDLTQLGDAFSQAQHLSEQDLRDAIAAGAGGLSGIKITGVHLLDASGLGDGGFGMALTMDMSELAGALAGVVGNTGSGADPANLGKMTMRIYVFGQGDYAGGLVRMGFSDSLPGDVDEVALAKVMAGRLASAP